MPWGRSRTWIEFNDHRVFVHMKTRVLVALPGDDRNALAPIFQKDSGPEHRFNEVTALVGNSSFFDQNSFEPYVVDPLLAAVLRKLADKARSAYKMVWPMLPQYPRVAPEGLVFLSAERSNWMRRSITVSARLAKAPIPLRAGPGSSRSPIEAYLIHG